MVRARRIVVLALAGCGSVSGSHPDAAPDAANPCAPKTCLLADDFSGPTLDSAKWTVATGGGASVVQQGGMLKIQLPAAPDAFADVASLTGFPDGATFEAAVTFTPGQFYDHKGAGFASARIAADCGVGEMEAAMFRGQDGDAYVETKTGNVHTCTLTGQSYPTQSGMLRITRAGDHVQFMQDGVALAPATMNVPTGLLPIRFSAYTYTMPPMQPLEIDVDWVAVSP